ncbi:hypothetical protein niasHT_028021 [Heterodera trifolii]|uniref:Negative elongation factor B n=1 Tax=Heterodera trifolii TaxID=157864 RepID=A0ABD2KEA4_9BILA
MTSDHPSSSASSSNNQYLIDLEKCGITTSNNLRELLTTCSDPVECIREFQQRNSIQCPSLRPVMKLLDLHGIRRTEYHEAVFADLSDKIINKLRSFGEKPTPENVSKLEQHLERSFRLYRAPKIRPIVLETLAQLPKITDRYLKLIICDKEFYDQCSLSVKQQIWIKNESLFSEAIEPVLDAYIYEKERLLLSAAIGTDKQSNFFTSESWKGRRQKKHIQELVSMVGQRDILYGRITHIIRERFLSTANPNYCSLHFELLMATHDVNMEFLVRVDPCHDFAWCLDACAKHHRAKLIDTQQMSKLKALSDTSKKGQSKVIAQMSLIAADPHILHMIASAAVKTIRDNAFSVNPMKPRDLSSVHLMVKMLLMGLNAKDLLTEQKQLQQLMDPEIFTVFLAAFTSMIVQDAIRAELANAPEEVTDLFHSERQICPRPPSLDHFLSSNSACALLWLHYLALGDPLPLCPSKRRPFELSLCYLEILPELACQMAFADPHWSHLLTHRLLHCPSIFSYEPTSALLIRHFFIPQLHKVPSVKFHLLHLCVQHCSVIPAELFALAFDSLLPFCTENEKSGAEVDEALNFSIEFDKFREQLVTLRQQIKEKANIGGKNDGEKREMENNEEEEAGMEEKKESEGDDKEEEKWKKRGSGEEPEEGEIEDDDDEEEE